MKKLLKNLFLILLVISCVLSFAACKKDKDDDDGEINNETNNEQNGGENEDTNEDENGDTNTDKDSASNGDQSTDKDQNSGSSGDNTSGESDKYKDRIPADIVMPEDKYDYDTGITVITSEGKGDLDHRSIYSYVTKTNGLSFESVEERFEYDKTEGYLDSVTYNGFSIYVNKYTGAVYYTNEESGKLLSSELPGYGELDEECTKNSSQIHIGYLDYSQGDDQTLYSAIDAAERGQISTEFLKNGIRVNYTLGNMDLRKILPIAMPADKFEELVLVPMLNKLARLMEEHCGDETGEYNIFVNPKYNVDEDKNSTDIKNVYYYGYLNLRVVRQYIKDVEKKYKTMYRINDPAYAIIAEPVSDIMNLYVAAGYTLKNLAQYKVDSAAYKNITKDYYSNKSSEIYKTKEAIYACRDDVTYVVKATLAEIFAKYAPDYTYYDMLVDEDYCGIEKDRSETPIFKCSIVYTLNADGSMNVRIPYNCIAYNKKLFNLQFISALENFGKTSLSDTAKYNFRVDGSVTVVKFD